MGRTDDPGGSTLTARDVVGALRRQWLIILVCVGIGAAIAGTYLLVREDPTPTPNRYATKVSLVVPSRSETAEVPATDDIPRVMFRGIESMANSPEVRTAALRAAGVNPDDTPVTLSGTVDDSGRVTLSVAAPSADLSTRLADAYSDAFVDARRNIFVDDRETEIASLDERIRTLRARYKAVIQEMALKYPGALELELYDPTGEDGDTVGARPALPDMPRDAASLVFERAALERSLADDQARFAELSVSSRAPNSYTEWVDESGPTPFGGSVPVSQSALPALGIVLGALLVGLVLAVARDRLDRTIRTQREAVEVLAAPVLATVPLERGHDHGIAFLEDPRSALGLAYRSLAATAIATDRLPSAILVTSPSGDAHHEVAANFAAALADLGVKVALIATSPEQAWYVDHFDVPSDGAMTFQDLLVAAHGGSLNGQASTKVARTPDAPNLVLVPPPVEDDDGDLTLDGLAPLLTRLQESGIETTVIAGPSLQANADATIMAWTTRSVLWAVEAGEVRKDDAASAAASLELTGVEPFGIAMLGQE